jgi:hypothetical protein
VGARLMAIYRDAIQKPIPPGDNDPQINAVGMVYHVRDGEGDSLHDYFDGPSGGVESHFYIRYDGTVEQYRDTRFEADANLDGNSFIYRDRLCGLLSVETEGYAGGVWTDEQIASLKALTRWVHDRHDVPYQVCPVWDAPGFGYHVMWGAPSHWTPEVKSCPGPRRIEQFHQIIIPWLEAGAPDEEDDMALTDKVNDDHTVKQVLNRMDRFITHSADRDRRLLAAVKGIDATGMTAAEFQERVITTLTEKLQED